QGFGSNAGTTYYRSSPVAVIGINSVVAISAKYAHTMALKADGTVYGWGDNYMGQLGDGTTGTYRTAPTPVPGLTGVTNISVGNLHTLAVKSDGTVWSWGHNWSGELGDGSTTSRATPAQINGLTDVVAVSAGYRHSLALK